MKEFPALSNPPIREALIDVQFSPEVSFEELETKFRVVAIRYGALQAIDVVDVSIESNESGATTHSSPVKLGYRAVSNDGLFVLQIRKDRISISRLRPYEGWSTLLNEFNLAWKAFQLSLGNRKLTRIAVRYINEITLPHGKSVETEDYLPYGPKVPPSPPVLLYSFFSRNEILNLEQDYFVIVNQALVKASANSMGTVQTERLLLDIDTFTPAFANSKSFDESTLQARLTALRGVKNQVFYDHTTVLSRGESI